MLSPRSQELAILTIAVHCFSEFEWAAHLTRALDVGWLPDQLEAIRQREEPIIDDASEAAVHRVTLRILSVGDLNDDEFADSLSLLGARRLVELSMLIGYYRLLSVQLRLFRADAV
jgi:hypothetical protein